jgi:hypothetical protein
MIDTDKPDAEELYEVALNTSSLKCDVNKRGAVDILVAGGWSPSRLGMALLRLHSAYDAAEKPERKEALSIKEWKKILHKEEDARRAHAEQRERYEQWYRSELEVLLSRLAAFPTVRLQLTYKAEDWRMENPQEKAAATIRYWLSQHCGACGGTKWQLMPGTQRQSDKPCMVCLGGGFVQAPYGQHGRRLANYMDSCLASARQALKRNLSNMRQSRNEREGL